MVIPFKNIFLDMLYTVCTLGIKKIITSYKFILAMNCYCQGLDFFGKILAASWLQPK